MEEESWRNHGGGLGGGIMEGEPWRMQHGGVIIEEAGRRRQPGGGSQEEAARRHPGSHQEAPGGTRKHPGGCQKAPRSVSASVRVSGPILLLFQNVLKGPGRLHAAGQRLRDPR